MITEVYKNIYKNEIPLPGNPLKTLNSYVIVSDDRNLIIDTGYNLPQSKEVLFRGIKELGLNLSKTDLILTHLHPDHSGMAAALKNEGAKVYIGKRDGEFLKLAKKMDFNKAVNLIKEIYGFEEAVIIRLADSFEVKTLQPIEYIPLVDRDILSLGEYTFEIVDIPGHSPGHIGLYEKKHRLFFCGDHILDQITPNIAFAGFKQDILAIYLDSLEKTYQLEIDYLFPAHRNTIRDHRTKINILRSRHEGRLQEIKKIITKDHKTPAQIAEEMRWALNYASWDNLCDQQMWFTVGEALTYLEHLTHLEIAERTKCDGRLFYGLRTV